MSGWGQPQQQPAASGWGQPQQGAMGGGGAEMQQQQSQGNFQQQPSQGNFQQQQSQGNYGQQQQPQPQQQGAYGQQQQQYGGPQQQQQPCSCCGPQPGQPQQQSMCGQQQPGQTPHGYCCNPPVPNEQPAWPLHTTCDVTTCAVFFFTFMSVIAFILVLAINKPDDIFKVYDGDLSNTAQLARAMYNDISYDPDYWSPNITSLELETNVTDITDMPTVESTTAEATTLEPATLAATPEPTTLPPVATAAPPAPDCYCPCNFTGAPTPNPTTVRTKTVIPVDVSKSMTEVEISKTIHTSNTRRRLTELPTYSWSRDGNASADPQQAICNFTKVFTGAYGDVCMEETLNSVVMALNLSRWNAFRATLYFIAMMGTIIVLALIIIVHRVQHPVDMQNPQNFQQPEPWVFFGSKLYEVMRVAWGAVAVVVFLWISCEMYPYWKIVPYYKQNTTGKLYDFWNSYDKKFVSTVVCGGIFVCWPLCAFALEIAFWFIGIIPWMVYRTMCAQGIGQVRHPEMDIEDLPGCVRVDMFYVDCEQIGRMGFSSRMWETVTGTKTKFLDCMDQCGQQQGAYPPQQQGMAGGGVQQQQMAGSMNPPQPGTMGQQQSQGGFDQSQNQAPQVTRGFGVQQQSPAPVQQGGFDQSQNQQGGVTQSQNFGASVNQSQASGAFTGANTSQSSFVRTSRSFAMDDSSDDERKKEKKSKKDKKDKKDKKHKKDKKDKH